MSKSLWSVPLRYSSERQRLSLTGDRGRKRPAWRVTPLACSDRTPMWHSSSLVNALPVVYEHVLCRGRHFITFDDNGWRIKRQSESHPATFMRNRGAFGLGRLAIGRRLTASVIGCAEEQRFGVFGWGEFVGGYCRERSRFPFQIVPKHDTGPYARSPHDRPLNRRRRQSRAIWQLARSQLPGANSCACARPEHSTTNIAANQRIHTGFGRRLSIAFLLFSLSLCLVDEPLPVLAGTQRQSSRLWPGPAPYDARECQL